MADQVRFHPEVPNDLASAIQWYDQISPAISNRFRLAVRQSFKRVREQPLLYGQIFDDVRALRVESFPYLVQYCVKSETTFILGVFHSASNPIRWQDRAR